MAITLVGTPQGVATGNGADVTITFDVAPQEGDTVYLVGGRGDGTAAGPITTGYTELERGVPPGTARDFGVWRKRMGATPDTSVTAEGGGSSTSAAAYVSIVLRGVDEASPEDATTTEATDTTGNVDPPAITTQTDGAWVIACGGHPNSSVADVAPSGYTNLISVAEVDTNRASTALATKEVVSAGVEDPGVFDWRDDGPWVAWSVAVRPAAAFESASLLATGDGTVVDVVNENDTAADLHLSVDDDPASPNDADWVNNAVDVT